MTELKQFKLPDVGEGLTEADILRWAVKPGDEVVVNQVLVEVETAKAAVELPSPYAGVVHELHYPEGVTVEVGQPIITIAVGTEAEPPAGATPQREAVLVGYGVSGERGRRRRRAPEAHPPTPSANDVFGVSSHTQGSEPPVSERQATLATPPVRKLAKDLGVDLAAVQPTGPRGTISRTDVQTAARTAPANGHGDQARSTAERSGRPTSPAGESGNTETRIAVRGVRKHTAAAMVVSAFTAPHVTEFVTVDVTETMLLRDRIAGRREFRELKVSPLLFAARALIWAALRTPIVNSTWDEDAGEIVVKNYINLGIAAATDRGLIVPNVKGAHALSLRELAAAMAELTETARAGRTSPADLAGGTITITNVGVFGVDTGTPILNPGEAAIVAFGAVRRQPWVIGEGDAERIEPRWVTQLAVSFDHRSVDGQQGSEFLADLAAVLRDPGLALL